MHRRRLSGVVAGVVAGMAASLLLAPGASADTCCANAAVAFEPLTAEPGAEVRVEGIVCLASDNSGPLELNLVSFWLSRDDIPADPNPGDVPGDPAVHLADDLPPESDWHPFATVSTAGATARGSATIVVPELRDGTYQLWWLCDNDGGPGSGIHYSAGPQLRVGVPDTATNGAAPGLPPAPPRSPEPAVLAIVVVLATLLLLLDLIRRAVRPSPPAGGPRDR